MYLQPEKFLTYKCITDCTMRNTFSLKIKEMHREYIGFSRDPGSGSSDPGRVIFDHEKVHLSTRFPKLSMVCFFWDWVCVTGNENISDRVLKDPKTHQKGKYINQRLSWSLSSKVSECPNTFIKVSKQHVGFHMGFIVILRGIEGAHQALWCMVSERTPQILEVSH